jgi:hypothetical protein
VVTGVDQLLFLPYQLIRRPLAALDEHAIKKLPSGNPVRELYHAGLRLADGVVGVDRPRPSETDEASDEVAETGGVVEAVEDEVSVDDLQAEAEREQAEEQRRRDFAKKEEQITRGNRSPATMARELAQLRAAEEARDHEAAEHKAGEPTD